MVIFVMLKWYKLLYYKEILPIYLMTLVTNFKAVLYLMYFIERIDIDELFLDFCRIQDFEILTFLQKVAPKMLN